MTAKTRVAALDLLITVKLYNHQVIMEFPVPLLDSAFAALADPTRRAILARLSAGEATVMELAEPFDMSQPAVSKHLRVLEEAGLITRRAEGTRRPCRLNEQGLSAVNDWLAMLRESLTANYDRLDRVLAEMQTSIKKEK